MDFPPSLKEIPCKYEFDLTLDQNSRHHTILAEQLEVEGVNRMR